MVVDQTDSSGAGSWKTKWGGVSFEVMIKISVFGHVMFEMPISNPRRQIFKVETSM